MNPITQGFLQTFEPIMGAFEPNTAATPACIRVAEFFWPPGRPLRGLTGPPPDEIWCRISLIKELAYAQRTCKEWAGWVQITQRVPFPDGVRLQTLRMPTNLEFLLECYVGLLREVSDVPPELEFQSTLACQHRLHLARFAPLLDDYYRTTHYRIEAAASRHRLDI